MSLKTALTILATILVVSCNADPRIELERGILNKILSDYNKELRPPGDNATLVTVNTYVRDILHICEKTHSWKVQLTFRSEWNDPRLEYSVESYPNYKFLTLSSRKDIWTPDLFFSGELEGHVHSVPQENTLVRIHPDGHVLYSTRITLELSCPGTDSAPGELVCKLTIASYAYPTVGELELKWKEEDPIQISKQISLKDFTVGEVTHESAVAITNTGTYGNLVAKFHFLRNSCKA